MDIEKYRRKIEKSIADAADDDAPKSRVRARRAVTKKPSDPQHVVANKKTPVKKRVEALGRATREEGADAVPETALKRLADRKESAAVRLAAIKLLQQQQFFSSIAADWRPAFVDALRVAVRDPKVRPAALEVLSLFKDRATQEQLLEGIRKPAKALVPLSEALRLLSTDVHADVIDVAKKVTDTPQLRRNKAAFVQAVRILSADPSSVERLRSVVENDAYAIDARRIAATGISHLSPEALDQIEPQRAAGPSAGRRGAKRAAKAPAKPKGALATHLQTLRRVRG
jgi:hypothetical protein